MPKRSQPAKKDQSLETLCNHCGKAFSTFLHQMEEHNAKVVVCPACGKVHDGGAPRTTSKSRTAKL